MIIPVIMVLIFNSTKIVPGNIIEPLKKKAGLEDIENAIIVKGIESGGDNFWNNAENNNFEGSIIYNDSFNNIDLKDKFNNKNSLINALQKQDNKWHFTLHKINKNENLWSIAKKYGTDHKLIIKANHINNPNRLNPGKIILVPNKMGIDHRVRKNETIGGLSKKYGINKNIIISQNKIKRNIIRDGDLLFIPDAAPRAEKSDGNFNREIKTKEESGKYTAGNPGIEKTDKTGNYEINVIQKVDEKNKPVFSWPLNGSITSAFGKRVDPIKNRSKFHCGVDIGAEIGTPVKAAADGETIFSGWKTGYGRVVILKHKEGYITVYAHTKENKVSAGDNVKRGEMIALSGMSGAVTGPHLHFEIRKYVTPLNPYRFLK